MGEPTVFWIENGHAEPADLGVLPDLLARDVGFLWLDLPEPAEYVELLGTVFGLHAKAIEDVIQRNHVARLHRYREALFLALHRPLPGDKGHVHYLEIDQFIGPNYLVTTHGPHSAKVPFEELLVETTETATRLRSGRLQPSSPVALSYAIVSSLTNSEERTVNALAEHVGKLEQRVMAESDDLDPTKFLDELFTARHLLLTVRTMAAQSAEVYARSIRLSGQLAPQDLTLLGDLEDQYHRLERITGSQLDFLLGVTDFYRAHTDTRMTIAAERLAVIAAVTLPVTAISSIVGMNVIVNDQTHMGWLMVLLAAMSVMSLMVLRWAKRQGWW